MPEIALRPKARADLNDIWDYTVETWGYEQAETYTRTLNEAFETLAENPELGRIYDEVYKGLRVYPSGKHLVFYFPTGNRRRPRPARTNGHPSASVGSACRETGANAPIAHRARSEARERGVSAH